MPVQLDISHYALSSPAPSSVGTTDPEFLDSTQLMSNESFKTPLEKSLADERYNELELKIQKNLTLQGPFIVF